MKIIRRLFCLVCVLASGLNPVQSAPVSTNAAGFKLIVELRDGSRVIGQSVDERLKFHSTLLGDLKLAMKDLRSIDCTSTNAAKWTTASGDVLAGWFAAPALRVETGFGKTELPVNLIRRVQIWPLGKAGQLPSGLVALWSGEGDGSDSVNGNNAELTDISFVDGKVGQAFSFNGTSSFFTIPDNPVLDVGAGEGFTVTAWIKPSKVNGIYNLIEWNDYLCAFEIGQNPTDQGVLLASVFDSDRNNHFLRSPEGTILANVFQHVALTYDKASGVGTLYVNGTVVAQSQLGSYVPLTKAGLRIGYRPSNPGDSTYHRFFAGVMDEIAIYGRALSAAEIQALCTDQNNGESLPPPPKPAPDGFRNGFGDESSVISE